jgi:hypothetical protein
MEVAGSSLKPATLTGEEIPMSRRRRVHKWQRAKTGAIVSMLPAIYLPHGFDLQLLVNVQSATRSRAGIIAASQPTHKIEHQRG